jgi:hypothetical protein
MEPRSPALNSDLLVGDIILLFRTNRIEFSPIVDDSFRDSGWLVYEYVCVE